LARSRCLPGIGIVVARIIAPLREELDDGSQAPEPSLLALELAYQWFFG
jgi:hypothetical protein